MCLEPSIQSDPCVIAGVQPFLNELSQPVRVQLHDQPDAQRSPVAQFIRTVFLQHYGAQLRGLYPNLMTFRCGDQLRAAVGIRCAADEPLFAEQYLSTPAHTLIAARWGLQVARTQLVEVGNLALAGPGDARWVIAAVTSFLYAANYRWVVFTAVRPLFNAFQRLGLRPVALATADPARLPDGGRDWGSYYDAQPQVCVGDIRSGQRKLRSFVGAGQPLLQRLLHDATHCAATATHHAALPQEGAG